MIRKSKAFSSGGRMMDFSFYCGNRRLGRFSLQLHDAKSQVEIWNVYVSEPDKGYGQKMFQEILEYIQLNYSQYNWMWLWVFKSNSPALHIYKKFGFIVSYTGDCTFDMIKEIIPCGT